MINPPLMAKKIEIIINGKAYPCRQTMGAMLRFKHETDREVTEMDAGALSDVCTFLWCCVASACKADGIEFGYTLMDFADAIDPERMQEWADASQGEAGDEKKSP